MVCGKYSLFEALDPQGKDSTLTQNQNPMPGAPKYVKMTAQSLEQEPNRLCFLHTLGVQV